jgi:hypothetical protein
MRRVNFDYPNTCPRIDKQIASAKSVMHRFVESLLEEACPLLSSETLRRLASENADILYRDLEDCFEAVRSTNEEMRAEAVRQISELHDEVIDLKAEVDRLEREVSA